MTGLMVTLVRESAHQSLTWSSRTSRWPSSMRPVGPNTVDRSSRAGVEVGVQDDLAGCGQVCAVGSRSGEVERGLGPCEVTERLGSPRVEGRGGPERLQSGGAVGDRAVEVEGVGDVDLGLEPHGAGEVDVVVVDRDVTRVDMEVAVLRIRRRLRLGEVEPLDGLGDEPVQLRHTDAPGDRGDLRVDEGRSLPGQRGRRVDGDLRDRPRPPRRHPAGLDLRPQAGEAVAQLEGVADELLRRRRRDAEDGAELGEAELRDQRCTLARDGLLVLAAGDREGGRVVDGLRRVEVGPPGCHGQEISR